MGDGGYRDFSEENMDVRDSKCRMDGRLKGYMTIHQIKIVKTRNDKNPTKVLCQMKPQNSKKVRKKT